MPNKRNIFYRKLSGILRLVFPYVCLDEFLRVNCCVKIILSDMSFVEFLCELNVKNIKWNVMNF